MNKNMEIAFNKIEFVKCSDNAYTPQTVSHQNSTTTIDLREPRYPHISKIRLIEPNENHF